MGCELTVECTYYNKYALSSPKRRCRHYHHLAELHSACRAAAALQLLLSVDRDGGQGNVDGGAVMSVDPWIINDHTFCGNVTMTRLTQRRLALKRISGVPSALSGPVGLLLTL